MTKKRITALAGLLLIACFIIVISTKDKAVSYKTFETKTGWGYNILVKNKIVIHQENIPALAIDKGFDTQQQASSAAEIVSKKIVSGEIPSLSIAEVQSIIQNKQNE